MKFFHFNNNQNFENISIYGIYFVIIIFTIVMICDSYFVQYISPSSINYSAIISFHYRLLLKVVKQYMLVLVDKVKISHSAMVLIKLTMLLMVLNFLLQLLKMKVRNLKMLGYVNVDIVKYGVLLVYVMVLIKIFMQYKQIMMLMLRYIPQNNNNL